jgi:hypothetical protein
MISGPGGRPNCPLTENILCRKCILYETWQVEEATCDTSHIINIRASKKPPATSQVEREREREREREGERERKKESGTNAAPERERYWLVQDVYISLSISLPPSLPLSLPLSHFVSVSLSLSLPYSLFFSLTK